MEEKRLDELLNEELNINDEEIRKIEKIINRKMNQKILKKALIVSLVVVLVTGGIIVGAKKYNDYVLEKNAFHLSDWEMVVEVPWLENAEQQQLEVINAYMYVNSYLTLFYPGYIATKTQAAYYEPYEIGYGTYQIEAEIIDLFELTASNGNVQNTSISQTKVHISHSNIWFEDSTPPLALEETKFQTYRQKGYSLGEVKLSEEDMLDMKDEIENLPETSIVMLDVMLHESMTLDQLLDYQSNHDDSRVVYVTTHYEDWTKEDRTFDYPEPYGFNLMEGYNIAEIKDEYKDIYPSLSLSEEWDSISKANFWYSLPDYDEEILTEHYLSCMKLLVNNDAAKWYEEDLIKIIADVEENGVSVKGFRIYATQEDALELFEDENVKSIVLQDVKLSKYQK